MLERSGAVCGIRRGEVGGNFVGQGGARPDESFLLRRARAKRRVELPSVSMITTHAFFFPLSTPSFFLRCTNTWRYSFNKRRGYT